MDDDKQDKIDDQLKKAESHAKRAIYDASESIVFYHLMKAEDFQERFSNSIFITDVLPDYIGLSQKLQNAKLQIERLRQDQSAYKNRDLYYSQCFPHIDDLTDIVQQFEIAKPQIIKKDNAKFEDDLKRTRNHQIIVILAVLAIVVAIVTSVI